MEAVPVWDELRPRFERMVYATSVTEAARRIYGQMGATVAGRRSIYYWIDGREPKHLTLRQIHQAVVAWEQEQGQEVQDGTPSPRDRGDPPA